MEVRKGHGRGIRREIRKGFLKVVSWQTGSYLERVEEGKCSRWGCEDVRTEISPTLVEG